MFKVTSIDTPCCIALHGVVLVNAAVSHLWAPCLKHVYGAPSPSAFAHLVSLSCLVILTTVQLSISKKITVLWRLRWWLTFVFFVFFFGNKGFLKYAHGLFRQWAYFNWAVNRLQSRKIFVTHFIVIFTLLHLQCTEDTRTDLAVSLRSASIVWCYKKNKSVTCASPPTPQWASFSVVHDIICYGKAAFEVRLSIYGHQSWWVYIHGGNSFCGKPV